MKRGWEIKKLGEVCEDLFAGGDVPKDNFSKIKSEVHYIPIYSNGEKNKGLYGFTNINRVSKPSITISARGTIGYSEIREENFYPAIRLIVVMPKLETLDLSFLKYIISNIDFTHSGSSIPQLTVPMIREYLIPLPPLPEQQHIVAILDEAFGAISRAKSNAEQNLRNAREFFESYLQSVFENKGEGWDMKTLEQISEVFGRGKSKHRPRNYEKLYGGDYPFIQTGDVRNCDHYITEYSQTYSALGLAQSKLWPAGTICITIAANIAETGVLTFDACFPDSVIGLVVNDKLSDRDFVEYLLQSFKTRIQALGKGSAQANINMGTFEDELFPFPSVKEQRVIVQKLDALSTQTKKLEAIYKQKIADLEELKKSLLQKAFNGELKSAEEALAIG